jgi:hypothetical protein
MTDLDATSAGTRTCPRCGAQNDPTDVRCRRCATDLSHTSAPDAARGDLELEEVWRAAAAEGFDVDVEGDESGVRCAVCGAELTPRTADRVWWARDTATGRDELAVVAVRCPSCGAAGRVEMAGPAAQTWLARDAEPDVDPSEVEWRHPPPPGSTPEHPLGEDRQFFEEAGPGTLKEQRSLLDDEGEDIRQYTGEPVETEEGWVLPQQQNVGPGNEAGGGEWPDPATPSAMPKGDEPPRPAR